jgi:uncharacterized membrane protein
MKQFFMPMRTIIVGIVLSLTGIMLSGSHASGKEPGVTLYTPYTRISVPPGQSIDYTIDVINNSSTVRNVAISLAGIPKDWSYDLKSGGWAIGELSVLPGEKKNISLRIDVPMKVNKGNYRFSVVAPGFASLPLMVIVSEQGTFKTEFTTKQPNMEGNANASFTFNADLKNRTADKQLYALRADVPLGWNVSFKTGGKQVTSVQTEANHTENVTIEVDPPDAIEARSYKIPVTAVTSTTSANLELEVVITGSYAMEMTTPTGLLSTSVTAGDERRVELQVKNNGSAELRNIKFSSAAPVNWDVIFDPKQVDKLEPGKTLQVIATIKADKKAIAGDYVTNLEAKTPEVSSKASFRVSVKTSVLYGWIGVLVIGVATGGVYTLFRKYGRR